jgi:Lrp/AsnC family leucine-responsive transcriptional regulator
MRRALDSFDRRILAELQAQGDIGPAELSERVHLSPSQCSRRLQRLKAEGYIDKIVALLSHEHLDLGVTAYVLITLRSHAPEHSEAFQQRVRTSPEILECASTTGEADYVLKVCTKDLASYNILLTEKLLRASEIATARSSIVLNQMKSTTELPLAFAAAEH